MDAPPFELTDLPVEELPGAAASSAAKTHPAGKADAQARARTAAPAAKPKDSDELLSHGDLIDTDLLSLASSLDLPATGSTTADTLPPLMLTEELTDPEISLTPDAPPAPAMKRAAPRSASPAVATTERASASLLPPLPVMPSAAPRPLIKPHTAVANTPPRTASPPAARSQPAPPKVPPAATAKPVAPVTPPGTHPLGYAGVPRPKMDDQLPDLPLELVDDVATTAPVASVPPAAPPATVIPVAPAVPTASVEPSVSPAAAVASTPKAAKVILMEAPTSVSVPRGSATPPASQVATEGSPATGTAAATPPAAPGMDRDFIARNQIVERYLSGRLPLKGATDFERFCRDNPQSLDELGLPERVNAGLRLLEASGKPEPWQDSAKRPWAKPQVVLGLAVIVAALGATLAIVGSNSAGKSEQIAKLQKQAIERPLDPATNTRSIRLVPSHEGASNTPAVVIGGGAAQLVDFKIDESRSAYKTFRITIDRMDQGRVVVLHNLVKDSNGHLRIALNSSALGAGTYQFTIEGLSWQGDPEPDSWVTIGIQR